MKFFARLKGLFVPAKSITLAALATVVPVAAPSAAGARRTVFARARGVDGDGAALKFLVVELFYGFLRFFGRGKFHESESTRFACDFIHHQVDGSDRACLGEVILEVVFCRLI